MIGKIASWSAERGEGTVTSAQVGLIPFGPRENTRGTTDFAVGERVEMVLHDHPDAKGVPRVLRLSRVHHMGMGDTALEWLRANTFGDFNLISIRGDEWRYWLGDCCARCGDTAELVFRGVTSTSFPAEDPFASLDSPLFRVASEDERKTYVHQLDPEQTLYCIVDRYWCSGPEGERFFVAASDLVVTTPFVFTPEELSETPGRRE